MAIAKSRKTMLYNGEVELVFEPVRHRYTVNGQVTPSVTTVLKVVNKPALVPWAVKMSVEYMQEQLVAGKAYDEMELVEMLAGAKRAHYGVKDKAANMGKIVHDWWEQYIKWKLGQAKAPEWPVNPTVAKAVENLVMWEAEHGVQFLDSEVPLYSRKYGYVGTMDFPFIMDGKLYVGDLKTSNAIYFEYYVQTAAYRMAREEEFPQEKYSGQVIIRVGKTEEDLAKGVEIRVLEDEDDYALLKSFFTSAVNMNQIMELSEAGVIPTVSK